MLIANRCVIFLAAFGIATVGALNLMYVVRIGELPQFGVLFGLFQIAVAVAAMAYAVVRTRTTRYLTIAGAFIIALERIWTVAGQSAVNWGATDWTLFVTVVVIPPFAVAGAAVLLPIARRSTVPDGEEMTDV